VNECWFKAAENPVIAASNVEGVFSYFAPAKGAKYCDQRVCMSICLFVCLSARI